MNPHRRRRYRRNPLGITSRGIVGNIVQGLKDGAAVVGGQVATRKIRGAITGMLPAAQQAAVASGVGQIALSIVSGLIVAIGSRKVLPAHARFITAGAFSETINSALAQTPIAPYLSAYPARRLALAAYPRRTVGAGGGGRVSAYPMRSVGLPATAGM